MADSGQHWLDRNRPPRVQITYDVETGGAIEKKEIPFVVGVMSDLSAKSEVKRPPLKDRKFVEIDRDNFGAVLEKTRPRVSFTVKNKLVKGGNDLLIAFDIKSMADFGPEKIVTNVAVLNQLFEARTRLNDLLAKLEGNDELNAKLKSIAQDEARLKTIQKAAEDAKKAEADKKAADEKASLEAKAAAEAKKAAAAKAAEDAKKAADAGTAPVTPVTPVAPDGNNNPPPAPGGS